MRLRLKLLVVLIGLLLIAPMAIIAAVGLQDEVRPSDVAIVLGSKVMPDGTPSPRLAARLDKALALYRDGMVRHIIVSGGTGVEGFSEARVMRDYLVNRAIPATAILLDETGDNTAATARDSAAIMQRQGFVSAVVVTQYFHVLRSRLALRAAGIPTVYHAHAVFFEGRDIYSLAREAVACVAYQLRPPEPALSLDAAKP